MIFNQVVFDKIIHVLEIAKNFNIPIKIEIFYNTKIDQTLLPYRVCGMDILVIQIIYF